MRLLRTLRRDERGVAALELGILIIPLSAVLLGILDMGYGMYLRSTLQGAINDVARQAVVENPEFAGTGTLESRMSTEIRSRLAGLAEDGDWNLEVASFNEFSRIGVPEKLVTDRNRNGRYDEDNPSTPADEGDCWIDLEENGEYDTDPQRDGIGGADDIVLYTATMVKERFLPMAELIGMEPNYNIVVQATVRNQPYANQDVPPTVC